MARFFKKDTCHFKVINTVNLIRDMYTSLGHFRVPDLYNFPYIALALYYPLLHVV